MASTHMCVVVIWTVLACIVAIPAAIAVPLSSNETTTTTVSENRTVVDNFKPEETLSKLAAGQTVQQKQWSVQSPSNHNSLKQCDDFNMQSNIDFLLNSVNDFWIRQNRDTTQKLLVKTGNKTARKTRNRRRNRTKNGRKNNMTRTRTAVRDDETFLCQTFIQLFVIRRKLRSMNRTVWCRGSTAAGVIEDFSEISDMISDGRYGITTNIDRIRMQQESCGENPQSEHKNNTSELVDPESDDLTSDTSSSPAPVKKALAVRVCSGALRVLMQRKNRSRRGRKCSDIRDKRYTAMYRNSLKVKRLLFELRRHVDDYSKHIRDRVQTNDTVA